MSQIISTVRCLGVALALVAAFATLVPAEPASAEITVSRADLEWVCDHEGGIYWESQGSDGDINYGCWYPEGDTDECTHYAGDPEAFCAYFPAPERDILPPGDYAPHGIESSQPAGGEVVDRYS